MIEDDRTRCPEHGFYNDALCPSCCQDLARQFEENVRDDLEPNRDICAPHGWSATYEGNPCPTCLKDPTRKFWRKKMNGKPSWTKNLERAMEKLERLTQNPLAEVQLPCSGSWSTTSTRTTVREYVDGRLVRQEDTASPQTPTSPQTPSEEPTARGGVSGQQPAEDPSEGFWLPNRATEADPGPEGLRLPNGIDLGTVVSLRGGGPSMTVVGLPVPKYRTDPQFVECAWEEHGGLLFREFPVRALMFRKE